MRLNFAVISALLTAVTLAQTPPATTNQTAPPQQGQRPAMAPTPDTDLYYKLAPDAIPQEGVPKGEIKGPFTLPSEAYPGTQHTYWVYVPAQYDPARSRQPDDLQRRSGLHGIRKAMSARRWSWTT